MGNKEKIKITLRHMSVLLIYYFEKLKYCQISFRNAFMVRLPINVSNIYVNEIVRTLRGQCRAMITAINNNSFINYFHACDKITLVENIHKFICVVQILVDAYEFSSLTINMTKSEYMSLGMRV